MRRDCDQLTKALGEGVVRTWSSLPAHMQHHLFELAVACGGEAIRTELAVFLHYQHERTAGPANQAKEVPEPDSLGG